MIRRYKDPKKDITISISTPFGICEKKRNKSTFELIEGVPSNIMYWVDNKIYKIKNKDYSDSVQRIPYMTNELTRYVSYRKDGRIEIPRYFIKRLKGFGYTHFHYHVFNNPDELIVVPGINHSVKTYKLNDTIRIPKTVLKNFKKLTKIFLTSNEDLRLI
jgi:hypothetical protein